MPALVGCAQGHIEIFFGVTALEAGTTYILDIGKARLWFQEEIGAEEIEMGKNPQEGFAKMNERGDVDD